MADVPVGNMPKNVVQPIPAQPVILPNNSSMPAQNVPPVNANSVAPKMISGSPWDDDLDVPETSSTNPAIIGSLDPKTAPPKVAPAPLKLPENMEEKVGKKMPATDFVGTKEDQPEAGPFPRAIGSQPTTQEVASRNPIGFISKLFRKNTTSSKASAKGLPIASMNDVSNSAEVLTKPELEAKVENENRSSIIKKVFILVPGLVVVFALACLLTEAGFLSIGAENVYGAFGIEQVWGGLSPKTENALGRSAFEMKNHPDFKAAGKISLTIDRAIQSDIVTPLLSLTMGQSLARDESINVSEGAIKTASDDYYYTTNANSNANSNLNSNLNSNISVNSNLNGGNNNTIVPISTNNNANYQTVQNPPVASTSTGTKLVEGVFGLKSGLSSNESTIKLNDLANSSISLVNENNQLFVKTSGNVNFGSTDNNKWLAFNIPQLKDKSLITNLFNLNTDSGFSVKGNRLSNEKVDNTRCYKYKIDSLEIGSSLSDIGITSDMVPTLSGEVWIGIKDKLIHRLSLKITTPVSSAVRMVNIDASFSDFDVKNSITKVSSSEQVVRQNLSGDDKRKADVNDVLAALKKYKDDNKSYPISTNFLKLNFPDNAIAKALVPRYLTSLPDDPVASSTGRYYAYKSEDGTKCTISARLDNQSDKEGSLVNNVLLYLKNSSD